MQCSTHKTCCRPIVTLAPEPGQGLEQSLSGALSLPDRFWCCHYWLVYNKVSQTLPSLSQHPWTLSAWCSLFLISNTDATHNHKQGVSFPCKLACCLTLLQGCASMLSSSRCFYPAHLFLCWPPVTHSLEQVTVKCGCWFPTPSQRRRKIMSLIYSGAIFEQFPF